MTRLSRRLWLAAPFGLAALVAASPRLRGLAKEQLRALVAPEGWRPPPAGPHAVGFAPLALDIGGAEGRIGIDLWYPAEVAGGLPGALRHAAAAALRPTMARAAPEADFLAAAGPAPLLLYAPSWFSQRRENSFLLADLASRGFVVAALDDVSRYPGAAGHDAMLRAMHLDYGSDAAMQASLPVAGERAALSARLAGLALDRLLTDPAWGTRIDPARIGALGYSFGGAVAAEMGRADPRIAASVNLDGSTYGETGRLGGSRPHLVLFSGTVFPTVGELSDPDPAIRLEAELSALESARELERCDRPGRYAFVIDAARHGDFCDRLVLPALTMLGAPRRASDPRQLWSTINAHVAAFLDHALRGGASPLPEGAPLAGVHAIEAARAAAIAALAGVTR
jgi:dienelactone hydrolase